ncbi:hypothetical protein JD844_008701, partial [Phrynosoma platyrhinos]
MEALATVKELLKSLGPCLLLLDYFWVFFVGDTVMVFPPPPPPYFADCSLQTVTPSLVTNDVTLSENPPPYNSTCSN